MTRMHIDQLPAEPEMYRAICNRDSEYEGVFFAAIKTTGIFCRPSCSARTPNPENVRYFRRAADALSAGYRPCKRCRPLEVFGQAPPWLRAFLAIVESDPAKRWNDARLKEQGIEPSRIRRWFKKHHNITFQAYLRARRLSIAMGQLQHNHHVDSNKGKNGMSNNSIRAGSQNPLQVGFDAGYESTSGFRDAFKKMFGQSLGKAIGGRAPVVVNRILTPLGPMIAGFADDGLCMLEFADRRMLETQFKRLQRIYQTAIIPGDNGQFENLLAQLNDYFAGQREFFEIQVAVRGTPFQESVWNELLNISFGETISYEQLAARIGSPTACRAVGRANGDNRIAILIPCHRVVGANGNLTGYGGGLWRKQKLLDIELGQAALLETECV
jgi:AraC family transcriptional regulator, regulatory protein of adaptative response / methylated-DNA-[protein]-cysteine methyltransferase